MTFRMSHGLCGMLSCLALHVTGCSGSNLGEPSAAHTLLYERLGRPAGFRAVGDTAFVVTEVDRHRVPLTLNERRATARLIGQTLLRNWPDARATSLTVDFQRISRFGPVVFHVDEFPVTVNLRALRKDITRSTDVTR